MADPTDAQQTRRDQGPLTGRGERRKEALLEAARRVFEDIGFIDARVSDIAKEARVAHGTFYTYFDTKEAIFKAVCEKAIEDMLMSMAITIPTADFRSRVRDSVRRFVVAYRPHATIIGLMEQVGLFSPELRELRLDMREAFVARTKRGILRLQESGVAYSDLDVEYVAESLGAMLEYVCYVWFSLGRDFEEERIVDTLSLIWERTLAPDAG